jgi:adenylylsulfate kinase
MSVIWITGLPGVGKSSAAAALVARLRGAGEACLVLDGDELRQALAPLAGGYDEDARRRLARTYANLAGIATRQDLTAVVATVSLFDEIHACNRTAFATCYVEVLLVCADAERERRRPRARLGADAQVGVEIRAEWPRSPDLVLDSGELRPDEIAARIVEHCLASHA